MLGNTSRGTLSLTTNTELSYDVGIKCFKTFRSLYNLQQSCSPPDTRITLFIAYLYLAGYKYATTHSYFAALMFYTETFRIIDSTDHFLIRKLFQGIQRTLSHTHTLLPITLRILNRIIPT